MRTFSRNPSDPAFLADPYAAYASARRHGPVAHWQELGLPVLLTHEAVTAALRSPALGRAAPPGREAWRADMPAFARVEAPSLLSLEPPGHTRLRAPVLRAFTGSRLKGLAPDIEALCHDLVDAFPPGPVDLVAAYAARVPVLLIARLLGVPEASAPDLLRWSHAMCAMYRPGPTEAEAMAAETAARQFHAVLDAALTAPRPETLLADLAEAVAAGTMRRDEAIATAILLLNAGHEATVHALGNAVAGLAGRDAPALTAPGAIEATVEEGLRHDPPLHLFIRWVNAPVTLGGHAFAPGDRVGCLLGAANRDPAAYPEPHAFAPARFATGTSPPVIASFGAGRHFCLGAPLARMELRIALATLYARCPGLRLAEPPRIADIWHFRGVETLQVIA